MPLTTIENSRFSNQLGSSLTSVIVASFLLALVSAGFLNIVSSTHKAQTHAQQQSGITNLTSQVITFLSYSEICKDSLSLISLNNPNGKQEFTIKRNSKTYLAKGSDFQKIKIDSIAATAGTRNAANQFLVEVEVKGSRQGNGFLSVPISFLSYVIATDSNNDGLVDSCGLSGSTPGNDPTYKIIQVGNGEIANDCNGTLTGGLCESGRHKVITFSRPFNTVPVVIVSPEVVSDQSGCVGGATDKVVALAGSISTTGFKMYCSGSPETGTCGVHEGWATRASCSWIALGN